MLDKPLPLPLDQVRSGGERKRSARASMEPAMVDRIATPRRDKMNILHVTVATPPHGWTTIRPDRTAIGLNRPPSHSRTGSGDIREARERERAREPNKILRRSPTAPAAPVKSSSSTYPGESPWAGEACKEQVQARQRAGKRAREGKRVKSTNLAACSFWVFEIKVEDGGYTSRARSIQGCPLLESIDPSCSAHIGGSCRAYRAAEGPGSMGTRKDNRNARAECGHARQILCRAPASPDYALIRSRAVPTTCWFSALRNIPIRSSTKTASPLERLLDLRTPSSSCSHHSSSRHRVSSNSNLALVHGLHTSIANMHTTQSSRDTQPLDPNPLPAPPAQIHYPPQRVNR
jgi:hypothetical protein